MKKIITIFILTSSFCFAWYCSSEIESGVDMTFMQLETYLESQNEQIVSKWQQIQNGNVAKLLDKLETKQKHMENIKVLKKEQDTEQLNNAFENEQKKQLNAIRVDSWNIER
jgi:hypothetical protein